jgi:hypothetical protein
VRHHLFERAGSAGRPAWEPRRAGQGLDALVNLHLGAAIRLTQAVLPAACAPDFRAARITSAFRN